METAVKILWILSAAVIIAECVLPFPSREEFPSGFNVCHTAYGDCLAPFERSLFADVKTKLRQIVNDVDIVCLEYHNVLDCLRPYFSECSTESNLHLQAFVAAGNYFCSKEGRSLVRQFQNSVCYENPERLFQQWDSLTSCAEAAEDFNSDTSFLCH